MTEEKCTHGTYNDTYVMKLQAERDRYREALEGIAGMTGYASDPARDPGHLARYVLAQYGRQESHAPCTGSAGKPLPERQDGNELCALSSDESTPRVFMKRGMRVLAVCCGECGHETTIENVRVSSKDATKHEPDCDCSGGCNHGA